MMIDQRELQLEVERLTDRMHDGRLNEDQAALLNSLLDESEDARRYYRDTVAWTVAATEIASTYGVSVADDEAIDRPNPNALRQQVSFWRTPSNLAVAFVSVAAAIMLMVGIYKSETLSIPTAMRPEISPVDHHFIGDMYVPSETGDAQGDSQLDSREIVPGDIVTATDRDHLLQLTSGVDVRLAAGSEAVIVSPWLVELQRGRSMVSVPAHAIGFRLDTPETSVMDLGTEFAVTRDESTDETVVHVMQGKVQTSGNPESQTRDKLIRAGDTDVRSTALAGQNSAFIRDVPAGHFAYVENLRRHTRATTHTNQNWHWDFLPAHRIDNEVEITLIARENRMPLRLRDALSPRDAYLFSPRAGQHCLRLDGVLSGEALIDQIQQAEEVRMGFDLRTTGIEAVPPSGTILAVTLPAKQIASAESDNEPRASVQVEISLCRILSRGPLGSVEIRLGQHVVTTTQSVSDGNWHRLEIRFRPNPNLESGWQPDVYLDKRLATIARELSLADNLSQPQNFPIGTVQVGGYAEEGSPRFIGELDNLQVETLHAK